MENQNAATTFTSNDGTYQPYKVAQSKSILSEKDGNVMHLRHDDDDDDGGNKLSTRKCNENLSSITTRQNNDIFRTRRLSSTKRNSPPAFIYRSKRIESEDDTVSNISSPAAAIATHSTTPGKEDVSSVDTAELVRRLRRGNEQEGNGKLTVQNVELACKLTPKKEDTKRVNKHETFSPKNTTALVGGQSPAKADKPANQGVVKDFPSPSSSKSSSQLYSWQMPIGSDISEAADEGEDENSVETVELQRRLRSRHPHSKDTVVCKTATNNSSSNNNSAVHGNLRNEVIFELPAHFDSSSSDSESE